jgi:hypothetical protein
LVAVTVLIETEEPIGTTLSKYSPRKPEAASSLVFVPCSGMPPLPERESAAVVSAMSRIRA